jgi:hypothetical protein
MNIGGFSAAQVAQAVWQNTTRTVTSIAASMSAINVIRQSVASGVILDLRPAAGVFRLISMGVDGTNATAGYYDGTTFAGFGSTNTISAVGCNNSAYGLVLKNPAGIAEAQNASGFDIR